MSDGVMLGGRPRTANTHKPQLFAPGQAWAGMVPAGGGGLVSGGGPGLPPNITNSGCDSAPSGTDQDDDLLVPGLTVQRQALDFRDAVAGDGPLRDRSFDVTIDLTQRPRS